MPKEISGFRSSIFSAFSPYAKATTSSDIETNQNTVLTHATPQQSSTPRPFLHPHYSYTLHHVPSNTVVIQPLSTLSTLHSAETSEAAEQRFFTEIDLYIARANVVFRDAAEQIKRRVNQNTFSASILDLSNMNLSVLPIDEFPENLTEINLCGNQLQVFQTHLPLSLRCLKLSNNQLIGLPAVPSNLEELDIANNQFQALPALQHTHLKKIIAANNQLRELPRLPESLYYLDITNNPLTHLPASLFSPDYFGLDIKLDSKTQLSKEAQELINQYQACGDLGPTFYFVDEKDETITSHTK